jgi:hypothetical protein
VRESTWPGTESVFCVIRTEPNTLKCEYVQCTERVGVSKILTILVKNNTSLCAGWVSRVWQCPSVLLRNHVWTVQGRRFLCAWYFRCRRVRNRHGVSNIMISTRNSYSLWLEELVRIKIEHAYGDENKVFRSCSIEQIHPGASVEVRCGKVGNKVIVNYTLHAKA